MADKFWTHLKLKNGDKVRFVPPAPDGEQLGGVTQEERETITGLKDEQATQDERLDALESRPVVDKSLARRVENLEAAARGQLYRAETDGDAAYTKAIASDVLPWGTLDKVGGHSEVVDGALMSFSPDKVVSSAGQTLDLSALVQNFFPDGMHSAGAVHDEIDLERGVAIKRVGSVDLGDSVFTQYATTNYNYYRSPQNTIPAVSDSIRANALCEKFETRAVTDGIYAGSANNAIGVNDVGRICISPIGYSGESLDGVMFYYELAEPIETPIATADLAGLTDLNVEAGGSLTFANQHGDDYRVPLPNAETFMIKLGGDA